MDGELRVDLPDVVAWRAWAIRAMADAADKPKQDSPCVGGSWRSICKTVITL